MFLFFGVYAVNAQTVTVRGTVADETGAPMPGVSVLVKNTTHGTSTDMEGNFSLSNVSAGETVVFSFLGYENIERVIRGDEFLNISLVPESLEIEQVVVTALGIKREQRALGYSVQEIDGESLQNVAGVDVGTSLTGKIAGVLVQNPTDFNVEPTILLRGSSPITVIDGVPYTNKRLNDIRNKRAVAAINRVPHPVSAP